MRSPDPSKIATPPLWPLLAKELRDILAGRALWTLLLVLCPLGGVSFVQAVALYAEASMAAQDQPALAMGLSPLDGVLVPSLGGLYLATTLLFPFVAIRALGREKETGALRLLLQLPWRPPTLVAAKMTAIAVAWLAAAVPALSVPIVWSALGGHLHAPETTNLLAGHMLYGLLVGAIALFAATISDSAATAAIVTLAFTIGSWMLDFALAGQPGMLGSLARISLTQTLRPFEQGLLMPGLVLAILLAAGGFLALAVIWLHPGVRLRIKLLRSAGCAITIAAAVGATSLAGGTIDVAEDRRNSFPLADQHALATLRAPLRITVHLAPEDPRYVDLRRNVLGKLERVPPDVGVQLAAAGKSLIASESDERYGEIAYVYGGREAASRSTSPREILPLLYELAGIPVPAPAPGSEYPGHPLVVDAQASLAWFLAALPLAIVLAWRRSRRAPPIPAVLQQRDSQ